MSRGGSSAGRLGSLATLRLRRRRDVGDGDAHGARVEVERDADDRADAETAGHAEVRPLAAVVSTPAPVRVRPDRQQQKGGRFHFELEKVCEQ